MVIRQNDGQPSDFSLTSIKNPAITENFRLTQPLLSSEQEVTLHQSRLYKHGQTVPRLGHFKVTQDSDEVYISLNHCSPWRFPHQPK